MKNNVILLIGLVLLAFGFFGNKLTWSPSPSVVNPTTVESYVTDAPADLDLLAKAKEVIQVLDATSNSTKRAECLKLSSLYADIATLIDLDQDDVVITDTAAIRKANSLSGKMLKLNIKDKYPSLAEKTQEVVVAAIGKDDVLLDQNSRSKASEAFRALSWAFYEGSK